MPATNDNELLERQLLALRAENDKLKREHAEKIETTEKHYQEEIERLKAEHQTVLDEKSGETDRLNTDLGERTTEAKQAEDDLAELLAAIGVTDLEWELARGHADPREALRKLTGVELPGRRRAA
jgi:seryl-tRNA synthetase